MIVYASELVGVSTTGAPAENSALFSFVRLAILVAIFYFLLIRPQTKRTKIRNAMLDALEVDDHVITLGGIHGTIVEIEDDIVMVRVTDKIVLKMERTAVNTVVKD